MTAGEIYTSVVRLSDITLEEQADELDYIVRLIRLASNRLILDKLAIGDLKCGETVYIHHYLDTSDVRVHSAGDTIILLPRRSYTNGYPLAFHYLMLYTGNQFVRARYVTPDIYWKQRKLVTSPTHGCPLMYTIVRGEEYSSPTIGEPTEKMQLYCITNVANLSPDSEGNIGRVAYWREARFSRVFNIVDLPSDYHNDLVDVSISLLQYGQFIYPPGMLGRGEIMPNFEGLIPRPVLTTNPDSNGNTVSTNR